MRRRVTGLGVLWLSCIMIVGGSERKTHKQREQEQPDSTSGRDPIKILDRALAILDKAQRECGKDKGLQGNGPKKKK